MSVVCAMRVADHQARNSQTREQRDEGASHDVDLAPEEHFLDPIGDLPPNHGMPS